MYFPFLFCGFAMLHVFILYSKFSPSLLMCLSPFRVVFPGPVDIFLKIPRVGISFPSGRSFQSSPFLEGKMLPRSRPSRQFSSQERHRDHADFTLPANSEQGDTLPAGFDALNRSQDSWSSHAETASGEIRAIHISLSTFSESAFFCHSPANSYHSTTLNRIDKRMPRSGSKNEVVTGKGSVSRALR